MCVSRKEQREHVFANLAQMFISILTEKQRLAIAMLKPAVSE